MDVFVKEAEDRITQGQLETHEILPSPEKQIHAAKPVQPVHAAKPQAISSELKSATALERLDHYENYLWLQFNQVYSVGVALDEHKETKLPHDIKSVVADEQKIQRMVSIQVNGQLVSTATDDDEPDGGKLTQSVHMAATKTCDMTCSLVAFFLYPLLLSCRLAAQVTLIPLLILQVLDTHAWICVMHNLYCDDLRSEYQLGLDKTAVSFGFYCSVLVSILATTMLQWFPCSKKARKSGATSIA